MQYIYLKGFQNSDSIEHLNRINQKSIWAKTHDKASTVWKTNYYFCTNNVMPRELLAKKVTCLCTVCSVSWTRAGLKKECWAWKTTTYEQYLKVMLIKNRSEHKIGKKYPTKLRHKACERSFAKASSEMGSVEGWRWRSHPVPNYTTGLTISSNRSYEGMNSSLNLSSIFDIFEISIVRKDVHHL